MFLNLIIGFKVCVHVFLNDFKAMFNGQLLFNRTMHVKLVCCLYCTLELYGLTMSVVIMPLPFLQDEKSLPKDFGPPDRAAALPREFTPSLVRV